MALVQIVTVALAPTVQARLSALRLRFFPARPYTLPAHITLLHAAPASQGERLRRAVEQQAASLPAFAVRLGPVRALGKKGFGVFASAPPLLGLRGRLRRALAGELSAQYARGIRPHIRLANKLAVEEAPLLMAEVQAAWPPTTSDAAAIDVWDDMDGSWRHRYRATLAVAQPIASQWQPCRIASVTIARLASWFIWRTCRLLPPEARRSRCIADWLPLV